MTATPGRRRSPGGGSARPTRSRDGRAGGGIAEGGGLATTEKITVRSIAGEKYDASSLQTRAVARADRPANSSYDPTKSLSERAASCPQILNAGFDASIAAAPLIRGHGLNAVPRQCSHVVAREPSSAREGSRSRHGSKASSRSGGLDRHCHSPTSVAGLCVLPAILAEKRPALVGVEAVPDSGCRPSGS